MNQRDATPNNLKFLNENDLVDMGVASSVHTLRSWRQKKIGPPFVKVGRSVKYRLSDVEAYLDSLPTGGTSMKVSA